MDSKTIRYQNTRILVEQVGGVSNFAEKIGKGQSQTSQFAGTSPIKGIGNKVAREIEEAFGKPHGWLDIPHIDTILHEPMMPTNSKFNNIIKYLDKLDTLINEKNLTNQQLEILYSTVDTVEIVLCNTNSLIEELSKIKNSSQKIY